MPRSYPKQTKEGSIVKHGGQCPQQQPAFFFVSVRNVSYLSYRLFLQTNDAFFCKKAFR
jgi:hypothetical protein